MKVICVVAAVLCALAVSVLCVKQATLFSEFNQKTITGRTEFFFSRVPNPSSTSKAVHLYGGFKSSRGNIVACLIKENDYLQYISVRDYKTCIKLVNNSDVAKNATKTFDWTVTNQPMRIVFSNTQLDGSDVFSEVAYIESK